MCPMASCLASGSVVSGRLNSCVCRIPILSLRDKGCRLHSVGATLNYSLEDLEETISLSVPQKRHCNTCVVSPEIVMSIHDVME